MKKSLIYLFASIVVQASVVWIISGLWHLLFGTISTAPMIVTASAVYSVITLILFIWRGWSPVSLDYLRLRQWKVFLWAAVAAVGTILPSVWLQEQLPELQDNMEDTFAMIMDNSFGYLTICIFAPLVEELVFRGAILRSLQAHFKKCWHAILFSAALFALIHANPAQMPHAFIIGILLGWLYCRTGSILPGVLFHWVNNTIAFVAYRLDPETQDQTVTELFGGNQMYAAISIAASFCILLLALYQLNKTLKESSF